MTETSSPAPRDADDVIRLLQRTGDTVAPHVAARLHAALNADAAAIVQVTAALSPAQRAGLSTNRRAMRSGVLTTGQLR